MNGALEDKESCTNVKIEVQPKSEIDENLKNYHCFFFVLRIVLKKVGGGARTAANMKTRCRFFHLYSKLRPSIES